MMSEVVLNLGAGEKPLGGGAINIDIRELPGIDLVTDASKIPLPDNHADKILALDLIEHFPRAKTVEVLKEWFRLLKPGSSTYPGGLLIVKTPNLQTICERFVRGEIEAWECSRLIYGGQEYEGNFHHAGFDPSLFKRLAEQAGFKVVRLVEHPEPPDQNNMIVRLVKP